MSQTAAGSSGTDYASLLARLRADGFAATASSFEAELVAKLGADSLSPGALPVTSASVCADEAALALGAALDAAARFGPAAEALFARSGARAGAGGTAMRDSADEYSALTSVHPFPAYTLYSVLTQKNNPDPLVAVSYSPDGHMLAVGSASGAVMLANADRIRNHPPDSTSFSNTSSGSGFGPGSAGSSSARRAGPGGEPALLGVGLGHRLDGMSYPLTSLAFHPVEPLLLTTAADGWLRVFSHQKPSSVSAAASASSAAAAALVGSARDSHALITATAHPAGDWLLAAAHHPLLRLYDATTLTPHVMLGGPRAARRAALEAAGVTTSLLPNASSGSSSRSGAGAFNASTLFSSAADVDLRALGLHSRPVTALAYAPRGDLFATASADGSVRLWDTSSGAPVFSFPDAHPGGAGSVAFSPSGHYLLSAGADCSVQLVDIRSMAPVFRTDLAPTPEARAAAARAAAEDCGGHFPLLGAAVFAHDADHVLVADPCPFGAGLPLPAHSAAASAASGFGSAAASAAVGGGGVVALSVISGGRVAGGLPGLHATGPAGAAGGRAVALTQCPGKPLITTCGGRDARALTASLAEHANAAD